MFVRMNTITGATDIDAGVEALGRDVLPELQHQRGFRGLTATAAREQGQVGVLSLWDTLEDLEASDSAAGKARKQAMAIIGGSVTVRTLEQLAGASGAQGPEVGNPVMIQRLKMDPASIDDNVAFFRSDVLPTFTAAPGFRQCRNMIDRSTGEGVMGLVFADEDSLRAMAQGAGAGRARAREHGVEVAEPQFRTLVFNHLV